jgi:hypothetical protein
MEINFVKDIVVPILIGVLSSALFLFLASRVKPRLRISPHIASMPHAGGCGPGYGVKVVNLSRRSATELKARLALVRKIAVAGGLINKTEDFFLEKDSVFELPGMSENLEDSAFRFITTNDIENDWASPNYILFSVSAKDSLTGFSKVFSQSYVLKRDVLKAGEFEIGHSMRIV